eukprot:3664927-Amphidinium_carterae.1
MANDVKPSRLTRLVDRVRRVASTPLVTTCYDARAHPGACFTAQSMKSVGSGFDRVLCDVPCSGDGTLRKARSHWPRWTSRDGLAFHDVQLGILKRGLELLAEDGLLSYSTCALNPVECEAVVAAALSHCCGSVELVPVEIEGLPLTCGLKEWRVPS